MPEEPTVRVLVVDDDPLLVDVLGSIFRSLGCQVMTAPNGARALEVLGSAEVDLILLDLCMPVMDGIACYDELRASRPELLSRVVICTGGASSARARRFLGTVKTPVLLKPVLHSDLDALVRQVRSHAA